MEKAEGSSPFIRFESPGDGAFLVLAARARGARRAFAPSAMIGEPQRLEATERV
jgi:hypothetical protein